jgi:plastocyanin
MRKLITIVGALTALAIAGTAGGATVSVSITKNGYVPLSSKIAAGDVVSFTNADTVAHEVAFKQKSGFSCAPSPVVLQAGQSGSCTFQTAGNYSYSDPNVKGKTFQGTVQVTAAAGGGGGTQALTLKAAPQIVVYDAKASLTGVLASGKTGEQVQVSAQPCGGKTNLVGATTTAAGGAYSLQVQPLMTTVYTAKAKGATTPASTVKVQPRMSLSKVARSKYAVRVTAASSFAGKFVSFQRYRLSDRHWVTIKSVALTAGTGAAAPTVVSSRTFAARLIRGLRVRAVLGLAQTGSCYWAGKSGVIRS